MGKNSVALVECRSDGEAERKRKSAKELIENVVVSARRIITFHTQYNIINGMSFYIVI